MEKQVMEYAGGNEMAVWAVRQIGYEVMGYYPITPSTQIAEGLDRMRADGEIAMVMIPAEGEHSAAGICYGAAVAGGRVFNATSANGLLYALEQLPVQSGTRYPMVMNVVCRTVSGPLSIKGDHSDIMYALNSGWIILFAHSVQQVYDFNIIALRLAEEVRLPVIVAYDGFFTSHQKKRCYRFEQDQAVKRFLGEREDPYPLFDWEHPVTVGSYMNEPDLINNRYQLHLAMGEAGVVLDKLYEQYAEISGRNYGRLDTCHAQDAETLLIMLGSSYDTAQEAVHAMRSRGEKVGVVTLHTLRPFPEKELGEVCAHASYILVADRQDSYGGGGGSLSLEVRAALSKYKNTAEVSSLVYGLGGADFTTEDVEQMFDIAKSKGHAPYYGIREGTCREDTLPLFAPLTRNKTQIGLGDAASVSLNATAQMPDRIVPGHGACPGCGIPVNLNLLLRGIEEPVVLLFQTGCGMIVTTPYPQTSFRVPYVHNLFQNGAATLSGIAELYYYKQRKGEVPSGDVLFVMVSGDGGMDIGMGSALGTALRGHRLLMFEYDNGGYMNTGYQLSYSTPRGAGSATSHIGPCQDGKGFFHKDMPQLMAAANIPYVATVAESDPAGFMKCARKAAKYAMHEGTAYVKAISSCPLNWNDRPQTGRRVISAAVDCCYFPLYEVECSITKLNYNPQEKGRKIPVKDWLGMMGRTKHLVKEEYAAVVESLQAETDRRFERLKEKSQSSIL